MKRRIVLAALAALAVLALPAGSLYYEYSAGASCARCHEIRRNYDVWQASSHRGVNCSDCHGGIVTLDPGFHWGNVRRLAQHIRGGLAGSVRLRAQDIPQLMDRCRACHRQEFAQWQSSTHSASYSKLFLDQKHNREHPLIDDCLRCHGMHFEGGIRDLVAPLDSTGPWRLLRGEFVNQPAIPCLTCHQMHRRGERLNQPVARQERTRPSLALYDRREQQHFALGVLPLPAMLEGARPVKISPDQRQALCYQCHAPRASAQVNSGDDRTPIGVHEGLSCLACHQKHGQQTRASCADCHPRWSNCGLDVEKMDTTFANLKSGHNIHFVKCADCHRNGVPRRKDRVQ
jgi:hypothetical protein